MPVTITIDDELYAQAQRTATVERRAIDEVLAEALRRGLGAADDAGVRGTDDPACPNGFPVFPRHGVVVSVEMVQALIDETEDL